jgi:hypothetical protein
MSPLSPRGNVVQAPEDIGRIVSGGEPAGADAHAAGTLRVQRSVHGRDAGRVDRDEPGPPLPGLLLVGEPEHTISRERPPEGEPVLTLVQ